MKTKITLDNGIALASAITLYHGPSADLRLGMRADERGMEVYLRRMGGDDTRECITRGGDGHHTNASIGEAASVLGIEPAGLVAKVRAAFPEIDWPENPSDED